MSIQTSKANYLPWLPCIRKSRCEVCDENHAKYRCPRCQLQTCSLPCVKQHKEKTDCSGRRDKTAYTQMSEFTDMHLLSDYRFLEDVGRKNNNAARDSLKHSRNKPNFVQELQKQAIKRHIDLRLMPYPMSRRKYNKTTYYYKQRQIQWQIEWVFPQADLTLIDKRVAETDTLATVLDRHTGETGDPGVRHKLMPYTEAGRADWRLYMMVENLPHCDLRYHILDMNKSITDNLENKCVVEYPTIHVVLRDDWNTYRSDCDTNKECTSNTRENSSENQSVCITEESNTQVDEINTEPDTSANNTEPVDTESQTSNIVPAVTCSEDSQVA